MTSTGGVSWMGPADRAMAPGSRLGDADECVPGLVSWNVTQRCNLRCKHCYLSAGPAADSELSTAEALQVIDQLAAAGTQMLILTGGEPTLRPDIVRLVSHASSKRLLPVLGTNGWFLDRLMVSELKSSGIAGIGISLDSARSEPHDAFRGVKGAWERAVRAIRLCVVLEVPVLVQMTVLSWNRTELEALMDFAHHEGAAGFNLYFLVCTGRGEKLSDITPDDYERSLSSLAAAQERFPDMMVRARCAPQISRVAAGSGSALVGSAGCLAARQYCRITPDGDVTPCPYLPLVGGNVRQRPFIEIWDCSEVFRALRFDRLGGRCGRCEFARFCGGCRARAFAISDLLLGEDPWCKHEPSTIAPAACEATVVWSRAAQERLERIPSFVRTRVRAAVEQHAQAKRVAEITPELMTAVLTDLGRRIPFRRPAGVTSRRGAAAENGN